MTSEHMTHGGNLQPPPRTPLAQQPTELDGDRFRERTKEPGVFPTRMSVEG